MSQGGSVTPTTYHVKCGWDENQAEITLLIWKNDMYWQGIIWKKFISGTVMHYRTAQYTSTAPIFEQFYKPCSSS